nr:uncharacterized protein LOC117280636 [Nicotiana tomentosiformis]
MPVGYKPSKFDIFDGTCDPHAYLRAYCDKFVGVGRNEKLRMKLFIRSMTGEALTWYTRQDPGNWRAWQDMSENFINHFRFNTEITSDRFTLATRAKPPLDDSELTKYFIRDQEGIYFEKIMGMMGQKFHELVKIGDFLEEGIKSGKVQSMSVLQAASKAIQSGSIGSRKKKKEETYQQQPTATTKDEEVREYKTVPWTYQQKGKAKIMDSAIAHGMTRSGRCYTPEDVNRWNLGRE